LKFENPEAAFTHQLNELRYYINCGIVVIICTAAFLITPRPWLTIVAFLITIPVNLALKFAFPEMNYFVRAMWVILCGLSIIGIPSIWKTGLKGAGSYLEFSNDKVRWFGWGLLGLMFLLHFIFS